MRATRVLMWLSCGIVLLLGWTSVVGEGGLIRIRSLRDWRSTLQHLTDVYDTLLRQR